MCGYGCGRGREREKKEVTLGNCVARRAEGVPWWTERQPWERETLLHGGAFTFTNFSPRSQKNTNNKKKRFNQPQAFQIPPQKKQPPSPSPSSFLAAPILSKKKRKRKKKERSYIKVRVLAVNVCLSVEKTIQVGAGDEGRAAAFAGLAQESLNYVHLNSGSLDYVIHWFKVV